MLPADAAMVVYFWVCVMVKLFGFNIWSIFVFSLAYQNIWGLEILSQLTHNAVSALIVKVVLYKLLYMYLYLWYSKSFSSIYWNI